MAFLYYKYNAGATSGDINSDIALFCTGATDINAFSASCDKNASYIIADTPAGWTLYDNVDQNKRVIAAPDVAGVMKYVLLDTGVAGYFQTTVCGSWDVVNNVGGNKVTNSYSLTYAADINTASGGELWISANAQLLAMQGRVSTTWSANGPIYVMERQRINAWDTAARGYPTTLFAKQSKLCAASYPLCWSPRMMQSNQSSAEGQYVPYTACAPWNNATVLQALDANLAGKHAMLPFFVFASNADHNHLGGKILGDIYQTTSGYGNSGDEVVLNGKTYVVFRDGNTGNSRVAVPKY
ncbi:MAG: hypothetical protein EPN21_13160 [Methylococcaceae bacterium]|nr:MAG: hypothetical protein EPN21_13160 [Methylococcaceae bacterium]